MPASGWLRKQRRTNYAAQAHVTLKLRDSSVCRRSSIFRNLPERTITCALLTISHAFSTQHYVSYPVRGLLVTRNEPSTYSKSPPRLSASDGLYREERDRLHCLLSSAFTLSQVLVLAPVWATPIRKRNHGSTTASSSGPPARVLATPALAFPSRVTVELCAPAQ